MILALVMRILFGLLVLVFAAIVMKAGHHRGEERHFPLYLFVAFYLMFTVTTLYATYNQIVHHEFSFTLPAGIAMLYLVLYFERKMKT
ncbi:MAG: hypothetical protein IKX21_07450 [Deltaproteobacteria bacterium]|nr:hypothetical protein [Deltaproteobacteria bacterium]